jgi:hypothetical protein
LVERRDNLPSGIGDQHVDTPEPFDGLMDAGLDLTFIGHIHRHAHGAPTKLGGGQQRLVQVDVSDDDVGAFRDKPAGDLLADAARRAGDDSRL